MIKTTKRPTGLFIELELQSQDFRWFMTEYAGMHRGVIGVPVECYRITETGPFQGWLWNGKLIDGSSIVKGKRPAILLDGEWKPLNYPIIKIAKKRPANARTFAEFQADKKKRAA